MKILILALLFLLSPTLLADCEIPDVLQSVRPKAQWNVRGTQYSGIEWLDLVQAKPTKAEVDTAVTACLAAQTTRQAAKQQARLDVKNQLLTQGQRLQALLVLLDLDQ